MNAPFDSLKSLPSGKAAQLAAQRIEKRRERQARQSAQRREQLLDVAFALFQAVGRQGFNMRELAHRAGYTPGALYAYFDGKEAILVALRQRLLHQLQAEQGSVRPARAGRGARSAAGTLADPQLEALAQARQQWLALCQAWWQWLAVDASRLRLLLRLDAPSALVDGAEAPSDRPNAGGSTFSGAEAAAAEPPLLEQFVEATQAWREPLQLLLADRAAAQALHEAVLTHGLGLLVLQAAQPPQPAVQARFEQTLLRWLDQAVAATGTGGERPQGDLFGA